MVSNSINNDRVHKLDRIDPDVSKLMQNRPQLYLLSPGRSDGGYIGIYTPKNQ